MAISSSKMAAIIIIVIVVLAMIGLIIWFAVGTKSEMFGLTTNALSLNARCLNNLCVCGQSFGLCTCGAGCMTGMQY